MVIFYTLGTYDCPFKHRSQTLVEFITDGLNMSEKAISKFNSIKSFRPVAWLALAILAVGAFGNYVQAQTVWLNETLSGYATENGSLNTTTSPNLISAGSSWTVTGISSTKKLRTHKPAGVTTPFASTLGASPSRLAYKLTADASNATDRPVGYLAYKITPGAAMPNTWINPTPATSVDQNYLEVGLGPTGLDVPTGAGNLLLWGRFFFNNSSTSPQYKVRFYMLDATFKTQTIGTAPVTLSSGENTVKIWYNKSSSDVIYTPPSGGSGITLAPGRWVAYVNDTLATGVAATGVAFVNSQSYTTGTTTSSAVGKFAAFGGSSNMTYEFLLSDIYVADSAPIVSVPFAINSATTATVQAGSSFSYPITTSGGTATSYDATGLPSYLSINAATGVISGTVPASTPATTTPISIGLSATGASTVTANLALTVTAAPSDFVWNNTGTAWNSATSWTNNTVPANSASTDVAVFGNLGGSATSVDVGTGRSIRGIVFNSGAYAYTWTGIDITVGGASGITNNSTAIQTFDNKVINSSANTTWSSVSGGSLVFNGGIDLTTASSASSRTLTFAGAGNVTVSSTIANGGTATAGVVTVTGTGTNTFSGNNTYTGVTTISAGTTILSGNNSSATGGLVVAGASATTDKPVLRLNSVNAISSGSTISGASSTDRVGTLDFNAGTAYTLNSYSGGTMNFTNSFGQDSVVTFTNAANILTSSAGSTGGRSLQNNSANLDIVFNGSLDIGSSVTDTVNTIGGAGDFVVKGNIFSTTVGSVRGLNKTGAGLLEMRGDNNSYNGSTSIFNGTISVTNGAVLTGTTVRVAPSIGNSGTLLVNGTAGAVVVSARGIVRGGGSITSLQVQDAGTVEVALGTTWTTGGMIDFAAGSKVSLTGTPIAGNTYTLMTASSAITGSIPTLEGATDWQLAVEGTELKLKQVQALDDFSRLFPGTAFDTVVNGSKVGLQYAFGSPTGLPLNNGVAAVPTVSDNQLTYTFDVRSDFFDANFPSRSVTYQTSTDLVTWAEAQPVTVGIGSSTAGFVKKQAQATGSGKLFIRINVTR